MKTAIKMMAVVVLLSLAANSQAQIKVDLKKKLEQQVNRRLNQKADQAIDKTLDAVEDSITADMKKDGSNNAGSSAEKNSTGQVRAMPARNRQPGWRSAAGIAPGIFKV
jgi:hypothetical protein